jgi:choloylglycine hydrolase
MRRSVLLLALLVPIATPAYPCTAFCLVREGDTLFGRNYDFEFGDAYVLVNQHGVTKHSFTGGLEWTTHYGSVTFNQYGKEFPMDGMNEAGLVVALMWLDGTEYPPADARPRLGVLEWIQYQLDNYASVAEVLANAEKVRVQGAAPLHYLISDRTGATTTVEYRDGRLVTHSGATLPSANLTNSRYDDSLEYLHGFSGFGGTKELPSGAGSLERFVRTAMLMRQPPAQTARETAFSILDSVAQRNTRWSVVYDATHGQVSWRTRTSPAIKTLVAQDLDFACSATILRIDANTGAQDDVAGMLGEWTPSENLAQLLHAYASTSFLRSVPRGEIERTAAHGEAFTCSPTPRSR